MDKRDPLGSDGKANARMLLLRYDEEHLQHLIGSPRLGPYSVESLAYLLASHLQNTEPAEVLRIVALHASQFFVSAIPSLGWGLELCRVLDDRRPQAIDDALDSVPSIRGFHYYQAVDNMIDLLFTAARTARACLHDPPSYCFPDTAECILLAFNAVGDASLAFRHPARYGQWLASAMASQHESIRMPDCDDLLWDDISYGDASALLRTLGDWLHGITFAAECPRQGRVALQSNSMSCVDRVDSAYWIESVQSGEPGRCAKALVSYVLRMEMAKEQLDCVARCLHDVAKVIAQTAPEIAWAPSILSEVSDLSIEGASSLLRSIHLDDMMTYFGPLGCLVSGIRNVLDAVRELNNPRKAIKQIAMAMVSCWDATYQYEHLRRNPGQYAAWWARREWAKREEGPRPDGPSALPYDAAILEAVTAVLGGASQIIAS
jgi:hypothetical protein